MDRSKFQETIEGIAKHFKPGQRRKVHSIGRALWKAIAFFTLLSGLVSYAINGTELFTKKIPSAIAHISKYVLLGKTGRPFLLRQLIEEDLALTGICPGRVLVSDFDSDGQATDLVIELLTYDEEGQCTENNPDTAYALMKDSPSSDLWPRYTLLRLIARGDIGTFSQGTGLPLTFEQKGKFLLGSVYATDFPGWYVYGYSNGHMHQFGYYRPVGSLSEIEGSEPVSQIGDKLLIPTEAGIQSFEITSDGQFKTTKLTPKQIVERNNSALVLEVFSTTPDEDALNDVKTYSTDNLKEVASASFDACGYWAVANGVPVELKENASPGAPCVGELSVFPITTVTPMVACDVKGFKQTLQFPWGWVVDPAAQEPSITCPVDGESESPGGFTLKVSVGS
ncbi:hypothetical protein ACW9HW_13580 [Pseudomonas sp. SDO5532_S415]